VSRQSAVVVRAGSPLITEVCEAVHRSTTLTATKTAPDAKRIPSVVGSTIRCIGTQNSPVKNNVMGAIATIAWPQDRPHQRRGLLKIDPTIKPMTMADMTSLGK
jgi:hypothetical protein